MGAAKFGTAGDAPAVEAGPAPKENEDVPVAAGGAAVLSNSKPEADVAGVEAVGLPPKENAEVAGVVAVAAGAAIEVELLPNENPAVAPGVVEEEDG